MPGCDRWGDGAKMKTAKKSVAFFHNIPYMLGCDRWGMEQKRIQLKKRGLFHNIPFSW
jgi:hypothetical protein